MDDGVTVVGQGEASAPADVVRLGVGVRCDGRDVSGALQDVGRRVSAVAAAARELGVEDRDIQSSGAGVHPRYGNDGMTVVGYQAFHSLQVTSRDLDRVSELVAAFAAAAGNSLTVDHISLTVADTEPLARQARDRAFAAAMEKAEQYAALAGRDLAGVVSVSELSDGGGAPQPIRFRMAAAADMAGGGMPVERGESTVSASVTVRWSLGAARSD